MWRDVIEWGSLRKRIELNNNKNTIIYNYDDDLNEWYMKESIKDNLRSNKEVFLLVTQCKVSAYDEFFAFNKFHLHFFEEMSNEEFMSEILSDERVNESVADEPMAFLYMDMGTANFYEIDISQVGSFFMMARQYRLSVTMCRKQYEAFDKVSICNTGCIFFAERDKSNFLKLANVGKLFGVNSQRIEDGARYFDDVWSDYFGECGVFFCFSGGELFVYNFHSKDFEKIENIDKEEV